MFSINSQDSISIGKQFKTKTSCDEKSTQTDAIETCDQVLKSVTTCDISLQTENSFLNTEVVEKINFDFIKLKNFLNKASNLIIKEIKSSVIFNQKFNQISNHVLDSIQRKNLTNLFYFNSDYLYENKSNLVINDITWNCYNNQLAVAYGYKEHNNWCNHETFIVFWNLYSGVKNDSKPSFKLKIKYCVIKIINHPNNPFEFLIATKHGDIYVISKKFSSSDNDDYILYKPSSLHKLDICFITYKKSCNELESNQVYDEIISCSLDGALIHWKIQNLEKKLQIINIYRLDSIISKNNIVGIKCGTLVFDDNNHILIGCEEGSILSISLKKTKENKEISLPITFKYESHKGELINIDFCSNSNKLFLTCSIDGEIRVYELYTFKALLVTYTDNGLPLYKWIPNTSYMVGINNHYSNKIYINYIYKKNEKYYAKKFRIYIKESIFLIHINKIKQLVVVNMMNEIHVFDTKNILASFEDNRIFNN